MLAPKSHVSQVPCEHLAIIVSFLVGAGPCQLGPSDALVEQKIKAMFDKGNTFLIAALVGPTCLGGKLEITEVEVLQRGRSNGTRWPMRIQLTGMCRRTNPAGRALFGPEEEPFDRTANIVAYENAYDEWIVEPSPPF